MVTGGRKLHNATLLADGKVLVTGGSRGTEDPNTTTEQSSIRMRAVGSGNRDVDNDGEPDQDSSLSLHCAAAARRARFVGRRERSEEPQQKYIRLLICSTAPVQLSRRRPRALHTGSRFSWAHPTPRAFQRSH